VFHDTGPNGKKHVRVLVEVSSINTHTSTLMGFLSYYNSMWRTEEY